MMQVKTKLKISPIHGIGLFADQDIKQGDLIWEFVKGFDLEVPSGSLSILSGAARKQFENYSYISKKTGKYILCFDDARFFNHADFANVSSVKSNNSKEEDICVANQPIKKGEELTCNYTEFDVGPYEEYVNLEIKDGIAIFNC